MFCEIICMSYVPNIENIFSGPLFSGKMGKFLLYKCILRSLSIIYVHVLQMVRGRVCLIYVFVFFL